MEIKEVATGSIAQRLGIHTGDMLCSLNGHVIRDEIDLAFWEAEEEFILEIARFGKSMRFAGAKLPEERLGIRLAPFDFKHCNNRCIFCFYDQMPRGLRKSLYERDDDFRLSFLYGNYITLTNMDDEEFARISEQRLSPLFISVQSTVPEVRKRLLRGRGGGIPIKPLLQRLADAGIQMHTQVVICPGINDGKVLERTVNDLASFSPQVASVSIVPVGLTKYRNGLFPLREVSQQQSLTLIRRISQWQQVFRRRFGKGFVYPSDEIFLKGACAIPGEEFYDGFPQLENGVGLSRLFLNGIDEMSIDSIESLRGSIVLITGVLSHPWLSLLRKRLESETGLRCEVLPISNSLFGRYVTVSGLLSGQDVSRAIATYGGATDLFLICADCLDAHERFIDDVSVDEIRISTGKRILPVPPRPAALPALLLQELKA